LGQKGAGGQKTPYEKTRGPQGKGIGQGPKKNPGVKKTKKPPSRGGEKEI